MAALKVQTVEVKYGLTLYSVRLESRAQGRGTAWTGYVAEAHSFHVGSLVIEAVSQVTGIEEVVLRRSSSARGFHNGECYYIIFTS